MELRLLYTDLRPVFPADLNTGGIAGRVQFGLDGQAGFGFTNHFHDHLVAGQLPEPSFVLPNDEALRKMFMRPERGRVARSLDFS